MTNKKQFKIEKLVGQIVIRGYNTEAFLGLGEDEVEQALILDAPSVYKAFCQNEFEAEQWFTIAALKFYWKEESTLISYLFNKKPC